jgi:hypothetical protein
MLRKRIIFAVFLCCIATTAIAAGSAGIGLVANNMMDPVSLLSDFVNSACFIIGGSFLFATIIKYIEHRRSPLMVPISTVVFLFLAGVLLILLPFAYLLTENGLHFSLLR